MSGQKWYFSIEPVTQCGKFVFHAAALRVFCFLVSYFIAMLPSYCNDYQSSWLRMELSPKSKDCYWLTENQASNFNWRGTNLDLEKVHCLWKKLSKHILTIKYHCCGQQYFSIVCHSPCRSTTVFTSDMCKHVIPKETHRPH